MTMRACWRGKNLYLDLSNRIYCFFIFFFIFFPTTFFMIMPVNWNFFSAFWAGF